MKMSSGGFMCSIVNTISIISTVVISNCELYLLMVHGLFLRDPQNIVKKYLPIAPCIDSSRESNSFEKSKSCKVKTVRNCYYRSLLCCSLHQQIDRTVKPLQKLRKTKEKLMSIYNNIKKNTHIKGLWKNGICRKCYFGLHSPSFFMMNVTAWVHIWLPIWWTYGIAKRLQVCNLLWHLLTSGFLTPI